MADDEVTAALTAIRADLSDGAAYPHRVVEIHAPHLLAAVEAALAHHVQAVIEDMPAPPFRYCKTCSGHPKWPCPEVRAIRAALSGEEAQGG